MNTLFEDFLPNTYNEWKESAIKSLKGADFDKKLKTTNPEGIEIKPIYLSNPLNATFGAERSELPWLITEYILINDVKTANEAALSALNNGANAILFDAQLVDLKPSDCVLLFKDIQIEYAPVYFDNINNNDTIAAFFKAHLKPSTQTSMLSNIGLDPIGNLEKGVKFDPNEIEKNISKFDPEKPFSIFNINGTHFKNQGANTIEELAFTIAKGMEYLNFLKKEGIKQFPFHFTLATGDNYFMEIAKLRAFRLLFQGLLAQFGFSPQTITIHSKSCEINKTIFDKENNMLRNTTEAMSAIIGGTDSICILPFDYLSETSSIGSRMSRNLQSILVHESYFDKVDDMAKGSGYVESLTEEICNKTWALLLEIEGLGGYISAYNIGFINEKIKQSKNKLVANVETRKTVLLGTNKFPNLQETIPIEPSKTKNTSGISENRLAESFEQLRIETEKQFLQTGKRKIFYLLPFGNLAIRKARVNFALNFFGVAGYQAIELEGFEDVKMAISEIGNLEYDYIVLCGDNESWSSCIKPILEAVGAEKFILAGNPKTLNTELQILNIKHFIFDGCNILEVLKSF
jgi:methylmalonyl-CoA mutase